MGQNREAIANFQEVVRLYPENYIAWFNMGNAFSDLQNVSQAIQCYRNSVRANPTYDRARHNLGDALIKKSQYQNREEVNEAIAAYRAALKAKPDKQETWANLGALHTVLGDVQEATDCLVTALKINPQNAGAWHMLGLTYKKTGDVAKAETCFREAKKLGWG
jgi:tetratricopeptide (TPR) repeat protein